LYNPRAVLPLPLLVDSSIALQYIEHLPAAALAPYIKCYYTLQCEPSTSLVDQAFATGCIEVMFTLSGSPWQTQTNGVFTPTSRIELWGQIVQPLAFKMEGQSDIFGIRFSPAAAAFLLNEEIHSFNNQVVDLASVLGHSIEELHGRLQEAPSPAARVELADAYLLKKLDVHSRTSQRIHLVQQVMNEMTHKDFFDNIQYVAERYGISSRYLQKIFLHYTGLTPKLYTKIHRFQNSLLLIGKGDQSLTAIAYECGYFDQSHFIREFKSFTGNVPSGFDITNSSALLASPNKS
jgi:AraC-like DNA-binding protein